MTERRLWGSFAAAWAVSMLPAAVLAAPHGDAGHGAGGCGDLQWLALRPDEQGRVGFLWVLVNFGILFVILNWLLFSKLRAGHHRTRQRIKEELERATTARREAEALLERQQTELGRLDVRVDEILAEARAAAEAEKRRILAEAQAEAAAIRAAAAAAAEREAARLRREVEDEIVDRAIAAAQRTITAGFGAADQRRLIDDYVAEVGGLRLGGGAADRPAAGGPP